MARRRRNRGSRTLRTALVLVGVTVLGWWWLYSGDTATPEIDTTLGLGLRPALTTDRPEVVPDARPRPGVSEKGTDLDRTTTEPDGGLITGRAPSLIAAGKQALERNDPVAARTHFSEALELGAGGAAVVYLRAVLNRLGGETIFSERLFDNDPFTTAYVIQPGDNLVKIASANKVSADLLADVNYIPNKNMIRAGRRIKIIQGPFRAVVDKAAFSLDVYLGNTFVRHYKVGLGADGSTPSGEWRVATKLVNPTYYPPRGGEIRAADDPENPLGERWIGLEGVGGGAVGMLRYGIHGTVEPDSIGQSSSMGCIRMYNEDVEALYTYLVERHSTVTIR